jgi:uncharacterized XkdX family phage protein
MSQRYYEICKRYYDQGIYTDDDLKKFVAKGKLTPEEYEEITGKKYKED